MDEKSANAVRRYVENGGTVIMSGYSAKADEHGQWFNTPLPGRLTDVFGLHTNAFYRAEAPLQVKIDGKLATATDRYYEILELDTAKPLASFENTPEKSPAVTVNRYRKGRAIYVATATQASIIGPLVRSLYPELGIVRGPQTPAGVYARAVEGRTLYVNSTTTPVSLKLDGAKTDVLSGARYSGTLTLPGYGVGLLQ
jgi:beta-galactosidase